MDRTGADVWADIFSQLMAERKPQDIWVLHPQDSLVAGHPGSSGLQYQLKGLSRLQCSRCPWTWGSAHVHILFHVWWDETGGQGLVRMCVQGQPCQLCPPDTLRECQVSPGDVRAFLGQLVLYILQKCYMDNHSPEQHPETFLGGCCEACDLGVCFLQREPNSTWGPVLHNTRATHSSSTHAKGRQLLPSSSGCLARSTRGHNRRPLTVPLLVIGFTEDPFLEGSDIPSEDNCIVVPFSLVAVGDGHGFFTPVEGSLLVAGGSKTPVIGQGSICLSGSSEAMSRGRRILINVRAPIFHDQSFPGNVVKTFELRGFLFGAQGSASSSIGVAKGQGPISFSNCPLIPGSDSYPMFYTIGLMANGEGAIAFPSFLANTIRGKEPFISMATDAVQEDSGQSPAGHNLPPESGTTGPAAHSNEGSVTFPFSFSDSAKDQDSSTEKEDSQRLATMGHDSAEENSADDHISISEGTITIPFSIFSIITRKGPGYSASGSQCNGHYKKRRLRSRFVKSSCGPHREEDFRSRRSSRRSQAQASEDFWICVSLTICIFWLMCVYRLNLGTYQQ
ncbi:receptor-transporting protein 5 [Perognathus longimembris pacificus]|uniref:receptor-transporting protein 5 n=1 Tax=Perognathus longimembris pacificus TaxID=214514 RepID=UPI0020187B26|nr:receptor-transporting protein 5 [Perognathus longimembris pacificus]